VNIIRIVNMSELVSVLRTEFFSPKLRVRVNELLRDLKNEFFSATLEIEDRESVKDLANLFVSEEARPIESESDMRNDLPVARNDVRVREPLRFSA